MAREKRDIICGEVVPDLLDLPVTFPFPPLGSPILEPNLSKEKAKVSGNSGLCRGQRLFTPLSPKLDPNNINTR